jgi:hypothetical protein
MGNIIGYPAANLWNSAVSYVGGMSLPGTLIPVSSWSRYTGSGTIATANTAFISWGITFVCTAGTAYDFTIRFAAPQIELGSTVSSWIPNTSTSAAVTRSADVADLLSWALANNIRSAYIRGRTTASGTRGLLSGNNNSSSNRIEAITSGADPRLQVTTSGSSVADIAANTRFRMAMRFDTDSYALSINGGAVVSDTSGARPTIDRWFLGRTQAGEYGNCYLEELALFYSGLNDSRLTAMGGV